MANKKNDLFYLCSLIEAIGRKSKNRRSQVVNILGTKYLTHIFQYADVYHCEQLDAVADQLIKQLEIKEGTFDNVSTCNYKIPTCWEIGAVYARIVWNTDHNEVVSKLIEVYNSWICEYIDNYNMGVYYASSQYLIKSYLEGKLLD